MTLFSALVHLIATVALATSAPPASAPAEAPTLRGVWPLQPHPVMRAFEPPPDPYTAGHRGVDLRGSLGAPVVAAAAGTVTFAGSVAGRGVVVIGHGATRTTYEPLIVEVAPGDAVAAGDRIGMLDVTQSHCFPSACLHWGWIRDQEYLDPLLLVPATQHVRLLPLTPSDAPGDRQP